MKSLHILSGNSDTILSTKIESVFLARSQLAQASKGQLISECPFDVSNFPKNQRKI